MNDFVNIITKKLKNFDIVDRDVLIFKITMEIHSCHEKLKNGLKIDDETESRALLEFYKTLAGDHSPITQKIDTVYYDCWDIPCVYSIELDETFPLIAYPYKLFRKNHSNVSPKSSEQKAFAYLRNMKRDPHNIPEYIDVCRILETLSPETKNSLSISDFF